MKFNIWLDEIGIQGQARSFFDESVMCFNVGAYRGALVLSMLGFQTIIKDRVMNATFTPPDLTQEQWEEVRLNLKQLHTWDEQVINLVGNKEEKDLKRLNKLAYDKINKVFVLDRDLRKKNVYWVDVRNSCVHGKEAIVAPHIELFWHFIQDNIGKFNVNGGLKGYIQKVEMHFDSLNGRVTDDFTALILELSTVVKQDELKALFSELTKTLDKQHYYKEYVKKFYKEIYNSPSILIQKGFISYLEECHIADFINFVIDHPAILSILDSDHKNLRLMWGSHLEHLHLSSSFYAFSDILIYLLDSKKIIQMEYETVWKQVANQRILNIYFSGIISDALAYSLKKYGYFDYYLERLAKLETGWGKMDAWYREESVLPNFLMHVDMDGKIARILTPAFKNANSTGSFIKEIKEVFNKKTELYQSYIECCEEEGIEPWSR